MNQESINKQLWEICEYLRDKTDIKKNYIVYISALLYIRYYSNFDSNVFDYLYEIREYDYIYKEIKNRINDIQNDMNDKYLFSNIHFNNIQPYEKFEEDDILSKIIIDIRNLTKIYKKTQIAEAYEYALKQSIVRNDVLKENGEFYTPSEITDLMAELIIEDENKNVFDPVCGSGNFINSAIKKGKQIVYGEERNLDYYNICKTKLLLNEINNKNIIYKIDNRNIKYNNFHNLLENMKFDYILSNPPFSEKNWIDKIYNNDYDFLIKYGLKPSSVGDYMYVLKMLESLTENGKMAVILPHGVLFRENEKEVRYELINKNYIDAIIGLPENLFYTSRMSVVILVISKNKKNNDVLFIDASQEFDNDKKNNILSKKYQNKIIDVYKNRKQIDNYSCIVSIDDINKNDFNLMIKKYIHQKDEKINIRKDQIIEHMKMLEKEKNILERNIKEVLIDLEQKEVVLQQERNQNNYTYDYKIIGENIKSARLNKGYSQYKLAYKISTSPTFINKIERGVGSFRIETLVKLSQVLEVPIEDLLSLKK